MTAGQPKKNILDAARRGLLLVLSASVALSLAISPISLGLGLQPSRAFATEEKQPVKVGFFKFDGYHNKAEDGALNGYGYDLLHMMRPYTNWDFDYVGYENSWAEAQEMLENGQIDLLTSAQKTPARELIFDFSTRPIGTSSTILSVKSGDNRYSLDDYSSLNGIRVGMVEGNSRNAGFANYAKKHGFSYFPVYYESVDELTKALQDGEEIDAIVTSNLRTIVNEFVLDQFDSSDFYAIVKKGNQELLDQVDYAIAQMDIVNPTWRTELWSSYYTPSTGDKINLTSAEQKYLNTLRSTNTVLKVLVNPDKRPYAFNADGIVQGIIPDIFDEIAGRVGLRYEYLPVTTMADYQKLKTDPSTSLVIDFPNNIHEAEVEGYLLTEPYLDMELDRLARKGAPERPTIAAVKDSYSFQKYGENWQEEGTLRFFSNFNECAEAVLSGQCDVTYLYSYQAQRVMATDDRNQLILSSITGEQMKLCIGVSDSLDHSLASILGKSVETVKEVFVTSTIQSHTVNIPRNLSFIGFLYDNPLFVMLLFAILMLVVLLLVVTFSRKKRMTEMEQTNRELEASRAVIAEALTAAESANRAKTTFLNSMSHDIRTPMNAIIGFASLAATHPEDPDKVTNYLRKIMTSSNHLLSLINDVLDMSRIESGKVTIEEKECSLPEVMHDLRSILQADVKAKRLQFYIDTVDVVNEQVICDKLRLSQVLLNCVSNAIKYTEAGGTIGIRVIEKPAAASDYANFEFVVTDTGIGMSEDFVNHIFEPFSREATSTVSGIQGTGLGMSITKNIVDMMGGTIAVESQVGKGTEITIALTMRINEDRPAAEREIPKLVGARALVVDDFMDSCANVSRMLNTIGMRADWTTSGKEAIFKTQCAIEDGDAFEVFVIDWLIPDMNGIEVSRRIRAQVGSDVPIIILTAYDWSEIEDEARAAGVTAFCAKPIFLSELYDVLSRVADGQSNPKAVVESANIDFTGHRILLVEDNALNREIATAVLEDSSIEVDHAEDGSVAVDVIKNAPAGHYDLVLMDIQMPVMDGYEATRAIRALEDAERASVPIVAMTANAFEEDRQAALEAGMNGHIAKPIEIPILMEELSRIFG